MSLCENILRFRAPLARLSAAALGLLLAAGCTTPSAVAPAAEKEDRTPLRQNMDWVRILHTPRQLKTEQAFPQQAIRQGFVWQRNDSEWKISFDHAGLCYAGFTLSQPYDLFDGTAGMDLVFRLKPSQAADALSLQLSGSRQDLPRTHKAPRLARYHTGRDGAWGVFRISLDEFNQPADLLGSKQETRAFRADADWQRLERVILVRHSRSPADPAETVTIRNMQIRPQFWARR